MVLKPRVRNEYRFAWREGRFEEIPEDVRAILEAEYANEKFAPGSSEGKRESPKLEKVKG